MSPENNKACGLCLRPSDRQDLLQGDTLSVCRACAQQGLVETLAQTRDVGDGETLAGAHVACSYCSKPTPPSSLYLRDTSVGSSRICTVCLGNAHALLTQQIELDARRKISFKGQQDPTAANLLEQHFRGLDASDVATSSHTFPSYLRADLQLALDELFGGQRVVGLHARFNYETVTYASLLDKTHYPVAVVPLRFTEVDVGDSSPVQCTDMALWLLHHPVAHAVLLARARTPGCAPGWHLEIAVPLGSEGTELARGYLQSLKEAVERSASYRGKVLSLERQQEYAGGLQHDIKVHRLAPVSRTEIILPGHTLKLLERNVFQFLEHRDRLLELNMAVKKGLLLYGPPGTGKTHTIRYLAGALSDHTTLLVTAEEVAFIAEYMALARLLSPSIVVIEDVDLIARDREELQTPIQEALLNRLLNEMDGLRENSEVLFILTTNRPESLEAALASRPGRIDQAIEFPLPDDAARRQLIDLYRRDLELPDALIRNAVERTEGVSAAFIKELMRRTAQMMAERDRSAKTATPPDLDAALNEMLFEGGSLNAKLLGASASDSTPLA